MLLLQVNPGFFVGRHKTRQSFLTKVAMVEDRIRKGLINMPSLPFKISDQHNNDKDHKAGSQQDLFLIAFCVMVGMFHSSRLNGFDEIYSTARIPFGE